MALNARINSYHSVSVNNVGKVGPVHHKKNLGNRSLLDAVMIRT